MWSASSSSSSTNLTRNDNQNTNTASGANSVAVNSNTNAGDSLVAFGNIFKNSAHTLFGNSSAVVNYTDGGAVQSAMQLANQALTLSAASGGNDTSAITTALKGQTDLLTSALSRIGNGNVTNDYSWLKWVAIVPVVGFLGWLLLRKKAA